MRHKQPSLRQLEYFAMVARAGNFRRAAEKLSVSQPTLTGQIAALEASIDTQLFERSRAGTLLSPAGRELLPLARAVLDHYQAFLSYSAHRQEEVSGLYRVGITPTAGPWLLPPILRELRDLYPRLLLSFQEESCEALEEGLSAGDFDLVLTLLPFHAHDVEVQPLFSETYDAIYPPGHLTSTAPRLEVADLKDQQLLTSTDSHLRRQLLGLCEETGAQLLDDYPGNSLGTLQQMAMMGLGMAVLPSLFVRHEVSREHNLVIKPLARTLLQRTHVTAWRGNAPAKQLFHALSTDIRAIALVHLTPMLEEIPANEET